MRNIGRILLFLVGFWALAGVGLLVFYRKFDWAVIGAAATWVLAAGVAVAAWQVWQGERLRRLEFASREFEKLNSMDAKEGLLIIYNRAPSRLSQLTEEEQRKVVSVLESMEAVGWLVQNGYLDKKDIEAHRGKYIRCWCKAMALICYERNVVRGKYGEGIEYLAKEAYKYQKEKFSKDKWVKLNGEICEIDISKSCEVFESLQQ